MKLTAIKTRIFKEGENLEDFIDNHIKTLKDKSILVITSKIVSLAEGRFATVKNEKEKESLIRAESDMAVHSKYAWITLRDGVLITSAGVDESNGNGKIILLPKDSFRTAFEIRKKLIKQYKVKNLGVIITDSRSGILRSGAMDMALGYAGFKGAIYYKGKKDIFGRKFKRSKVDHANALATASGLVMGEGNERSPLAIIENAPVQFTDRPTDSSELFISIKEDMYLPYINKFAKIKDNEKRK